MSIFYFYIVLTAIHHMFPCAVVSSPNPAVAVGTDQMRNQLGETQDVVW